MYCCYSSNIPSFRRLRTRTRLGNTLYVPSTTEFGLLMDPYQAEEKGEVYMGKRAKCYERIVYMLKTKEHGSNAGRMIFNGDGAWRCMRTALINMDTLDFNGVLDFVGDFALEEDGRMRSPLLSLEHLSLAGFTIILSAFGADLASKFKVRWCYLTKRKMPY